MDWLNRLLENGIRYLTKEIPNGMFSYKVMEYKEAATALDWAIGLVVLGLIIYGIARTITCRWFFVFYIICSFGILLNWPEIWTGTRFYLHLIPFFFLYSLIGFYQLTKKLIPQKRRLLHYGLMIILFFGLTSFSSKRIRELDKFSKSRYTKGFNDYLEIAKWCEYNLGNKQVVACRKAGLFYLYSNHYVTTYKHTLNREELIEHLKDSKATHVILDQLGFSSTSRHLYPAIQKYPYKFKRIHKAESSDTYVMEFRPELGYSGSFDEDEKRSGFGKFTFENGQIFEGNWKNHVREGEGKLLLKNGNVLVGNWIRDKLVGTV
ncbi:MAG: hypothetical protein OXH57_06845 [Ekhidna sp.]|nr:hypothetical protein [Ekhidna sp.]